MPGTLPALAMTLAAVALFATAAATDIVDRRIPNRLVAALAALGLLRILLDLASAPAIGTGLGMAAGDLGIAALLLVAGAAVFHAGAIGGGDVKLLAAGALWLGAGAVWPFLLVTAVAGGLLALGYVAALAWAPGADRIKPGLPYGVAIAVGGIAASLSPL